MCERLCYRRRIGPAVAGLVAIFAAVSLGFAPVPATACATVSACVFGSNTHGVPAGGFGADAGAAGSSLNGDGVDGATYFASTNSNAKSGIAGFDFSKTGTRNSGVFGFSALGSAVHGTTNRGTGVIGVATSPQGIGVRALGAAHALDAGVVNGTGLFVHDTTNLNFTNNVGIAVSVLGDGIDVGTDNGGRGLNVFAGPTSAGGASIESAGDTALNIVQDSAATPLFISAATAGDVILVPGVLALDGFGNMTISGSLTQNGSPMSVTKATAGRSLRTYAPREAEATLEDVGATTVTSGRGTVALDAPFASAIAPYRPYYVFLTAEGDNRGLYVSSKDARGFSIRESNGGSSTLHVQYRIVAQPYDAAGSARLEPITTAMPYANGRVAAHIAALKLQIARTKNVMTRLQSSQPLERTLR